MHAQCVSAIASVRSKPWRGAAARRRQAARGEKSKSVRCLESMMSCRRESGCFFFLSSLFFALAHCARSRASLITSRAPCCLRAAPFIPDKRREPREHLAAGRASRRGWKANALVQRSRRRCFQCSTNRGACLRRCFSVQCRASVTRPLARAALP